MKKKIGIAMMRNEWTNGEWTISQKDVDTVEISGPFKQTCLIHGGDLESVLSGLCAAFDFGHSEGYYKARIEED